MINKLDSIMETKNMSVLFCDILGVELKKLFEDTLLEIRETEDALIAEMKKEA